MVPTPRETEPSAADDLELIEPENPLPPIRLADLPKPLQDAAARAGWSELMPVQARALPYLMADRDLLIQSRTGSGKTGAFLLPILERLDAEEPTTQALILVPTRELARQVAEEAVTLAGPGGLRTAAVYGGVAYQPQLDALEAGAQLVVGTPGRILDHLMRRSLTLEHLRTLVFDEADRMLSMGFYPDMKAVQRYMPARRVHACMFSATFPQRVRVLARQFLANPEFLSLSKDHVAVDHIDHLFYMAPGLDKDRGLVRLLEIENPAAALIFCNTKSKVHYVATVLRRFGHDADELSSDLAQNDRDRVLARVHAGELRFLVATDVAARGIDIAELPCVVQYEPPDDPELYVHRAGRTGRAGAGGVAYTLVSPGVELVALRHIQKRFGIDFVEKPLPSDADVEAVVSQRLTALLEAKLRKRDRLEIERMRRFLPLARSLADQGGDASVLAMLLDDFYHGALHGRRDENDASAAGDGEDDSGPGASAGKSRERPPRERKPRAEGASSAKPRRAGGARRRR